ncbi:CynX/NimT family MFS transporter [Paraburkholderia sp.]|uniref:MFS transporter n=1 Tax=Paraburkholderia sp. TaxID=1926495 RepID=UPI003D6DB900
MTNAPDTRLAGTVSMPQQTPWWAISNVLFAGIAAALHVGKASIAMPQLQHEFGRSLASLSWVMSAFPLIGVFGGIAAGALVQRWGDRRLLGVGLVIIAAASAAGSLMHDFAWLIGSRFVEGLGFLIVVVAAPAVLNRVARPGTHHVVFGVWSTFMAIGMSLSLLFGPLLGGWRSSWLVSAALALLAAALLPLTVPRAQLPRHARPSRSSMLHALRDLLRRAPPVLLALAFATYTLQFSALTTFLPIFLIQRMGMPVGTAGVLSAAIVAVNIVGNVSAGPLLSRGVRPAMLLACASLAMGIAGAGVFQSAIPDDVAVLLCFAFSAIGGMLPAAILTCTPLASREPALAPLGLGLVMQGNYLGQVLGPVVVSMVVASMGWSAAALPVLVAAVLGAVLGGFVKLERSVAR